MSDNGSTNLCGLLDAVIVKLKYDESYDFEHEGEDEMMFIEYRKQLKVLFDTIAQVVTYLPVAFLCKVYMQGSHQ